MQQTFGTQWKQGDRVADREDEDKDPIRVVDGDVGVANNKMVNGMLICEHENNKPYPQDDTVVEVVFEHKLNSLVDDWRETHPNLKDRLQQFEEKWGAEVRTYFYPASRLVKVEEEEEN